MIETIIQHPVPISWFECLQDWILLRVKTFTQDLRSIDQVFEVLEAKCYYWVAKIALVVISISKCDWTSNGLVGQLLNWLKYGLQGIIYQDTVFIF